MQFTGHASGLNFNTKLQNVHSVAKVGSR